MSKKIKYKKADASSFDAPKINHYLNDEFGQWGKVDFGQAFKSWDKSVIISGKKQTPIVFESKNKLKK